MAFLTPLLRLRATSHPASLPGGRYLGPTVFINVENIIKISIIINYAGPNEVITGASK